MKIYIVNFTQEVVMDICEIHSVSLMKLLNKENASYQGNVRSCSFNSVNGEY